MTYEDFKSEVLGKGFDVDGYFGEQCVDLAMYYCQRLGYPHPNCTKTGYAQDWWTERKTNGLLNNFDEVEVLEPGDLTIFKRTAYTPLSHVAIFDHDIDGVNGAFLGQNQGGKVVSLSGGSAANIISLPYSATHDTAFRPKCFAGSISTSELDPVWPMEGADLSEHNRSDGWFNLDFLIPRCSYGEHEDKNLSIYVSKFKDLIKGIYVFSYALDVQQAKQEAAYAINLAKKHGLDPVIFYDYEYDSVRWSRQNGLDPSAADVQAMTKAFVDTITSAGYQPGVYLNLDYWNTYYKNYSFRDQKIWFACYSPSLSIPAGSVDIWQYSSDGYDHNRAKVDAFKRLVKAPTLDQAPERSVYRFYNPNSGDHLYTINYDEAKSVLMAGWAYEGVEWVAPEKGDPVARLYLDGKHLYTSDPEEKAALCHTGWSDEGVAFRSSGNQPVYRMYNPNSGQHLLTAGREEHNALSAHGWYCEGQDIKY